MVDEAPGIAAAAVLLANATAAAPTLRAGSDGAAAFESALTQLCESLAEALALRVPGARKLVVGTVHGAADHTDALAAPRAIAGSVPPRAAPAGGAGSARRAGHRRGGVAAGPGRGQLRPGHLGRRRPLGPPRRAGRGLGGR